MPMPMRGRSFLLAGILATPVGAGRCRQTRVTADSVHEAGVDEFAAIPIEYDRQVARAIESALQPGWRDIESAPKDGTRIILGSSDGAWMAEYQPVYQSGYRPDNPWFSVMLNHAHMGRFPKAKPTHWQPIPPAPKATK